ncbi:C4b-binding protein alpha chain-like isoform X2 [Salminus brasiliensis]|uniref:C4b-binding protein alpha chain-like isoform X2 n=1 Tax=Salminus brasiliensis TaxID=930266 RepID=UPI003B833603
MLRHVFLLFVSLLKAVNIRAECQEPTLPDNVILAGDSYGQKTFSNGSTVKLTCVVGYKAVRFAKKSIQCLGDQWTDLEFQCQKKSCGALGEIYNGRYLYEEGIEFGATVTAECNPGYQLFGQNTRICREGGWSGRAPVCEAVKCTEPPRIDNGRLEEPHYEVYEHGQSVSYSCNKDYNMIGTATITCSSNGLFQPSPPQCLKISCDSPYIPNAIRIEGRSAPYKYKSFVRYRCERGYKMNGPDYLVCETGGNWNPPPPKCEVITCQKQDIDNGQINGPRKESYNYGEAVTYSCVKGFGLQGASEIRCSDDGFFQPPPPRCEVVTCQKQDIDNGLITNGPRKESYNYGEAVTYSCVKGFRLQGASEIRCSDDGFFQPPPPRCEVVTCPKPSDIYNGKFNDPPKESYNYREAVTYFCEEGFRLQGAAKIYCSDDGIFQPPPPQCEVVTCQKQDIDNGLITNGPRKESYNYGEAVTYSCVKGFRLQGASEIRCSDDGFFQPPPPQCEVVTCQKQDIDNGLITNGPRKESYNYGEAVTYSCVKGFRLQGASEIRCSDDGFFQPPPPQCEVVTCQKQDIDNGLITNGPRKESYNYGEAVTYSCVKGFRLQGASEIRCSDDGFFHPPPPQCEVVTCQKQDLDNGLITNGPRKESYNYGEAVTYSCKEGFRLQGASEIHCSDYGIFQPPPPWCEEVTCTAPPAIDNGQFDPLQKLYEYGQTVTYSCTIGFSLDGASTINCSLDGTFYPSPPQCVDYLKNAMVVSLCLVSLILALVIVVFLVKKKKSSARVNSGKVTLKIEEGKPLSPSVS